MNGKASEQTAPRRGWPAACLTALGVVGLASLSAVPAALQPGQTTLRMGQWALGSSAACLAAGAWGIWAIAPGGVKQQRWTLWVGLLSMGALTPLALQWNADAIRANLAMVLISLAVGASILLPRGIWPAGPVLTGLACACDATAMIWPVAWAWTAYRAKGEGTRAISIIIGGVAGVLVNWKVGGPLVATRMIVGGVFAAQANVMLLLPALLLGGAGVMRARDQRRNEPGGRLSGQLTRAAEAGAVGIGLILVGAPLDVRLCALPLWWHMPEGLTDLVEMLGRPRERTFMVRWTAGLSCLVLAMLTLASLRHWLDAPLTALYVLTAQG
jgi:hypothetical protein